MDSFASSLLCIDMAKPDLHHASGHEMPIFMRTYDFLTWLLPATNHFPRAHPHTSRRAALGCSLAGWNECREFQRWVSPGLTQPTASTMLHRSEVTAAG